MSKRLTVIKPFFIMEVGDTFELSQDGADYVSACSIESDETSDKNNSIRSSYNSVYKISKEYAKVLVDEGYLEESIMENPVKTSFINVFDEINTLLGKYSKELSTIDKDYKDAPACMKLEKQTVLENMIKLLMHLNSLKK